MTLVIDTIDKLSMTVNKRVKNKNRLDIKSLIDM